MVFIHANTKLIDKVTDVCYEEPSASWELEPEPDSEDAEAETYDTDSTSETDKLNIAVLRTVETNF